MPNRDLHNQILPIVSIVCQFTNHWSIEVEYRAIANATTELTWLQFLLQELGIFLSKLVMLWPDNVGAIYLTANPIFHARTKHVEIDFHFVHDKVSKRALNARFISTKNQLANSLTKASSSNKFHDFDSGSSFVIVHWVCRGVKKYNPYWQIKIKTNAPL